ncbi:MAG TPA: DEAD/DEAH box helicase [Gammaproteobacteria bacterium]|nr:DEAD/DEAH box helicase [Gammaproteobacteria bacterium]
MSNDNHLTEITFQSLDLPAALQQGIAELGYSHCTPIQAQSLPLLLKGRDVAGQAQTGTGKTAAFLIAMFDRLLRKRPAEGGGSRPRGIVIAPTRELAVQIHKDGTALARHTGLRLAVIYGGAGYESQQETLRQGVDVLIGTPGRMIDFFKQRLFSLKGVEAVVLDEADRMFDLGFIRDIRYLLRRMPPPSERLTMLFSATLSFRVMELAYEHMNNPELVRIETDRVTADKVQQSIYYTSNDEKIPLLLGLLRRLEPRRSLVFTNTKHAANRVCDYLRHNGFDAAVLSGDVPQKKRLSLLKRFQQGELAILVATDVAARGLHIPDISHVFNFDLPQDPEDYVHRIGRTARAGASGTAISFACEDYAFYLPDIEAYLQHKIPMAAISDELLVTPEVPPRPPRKRAGQRKGRRPGGARRQGHRGGRRRAG